MDKYLIDDHKLLYHPERVAALAEAGREWEKHQNLKPLYAEISSAGACNHRCTFCSVDYIGYKSVFISRNTLHKFFEDGSQLGLKAVMFAGDGEPLLNPEIEGIVEDAKKFGIDTSFTTNGVHLKSSFINNSLKNVSWVKVSMNAGNAETYEKIHRTNIKDFNKVWKNIQEAIKTRANSKGNIKTAIGVQSLILPDNIDSLPELASRASDNGVDYLVIKPYVHNVYMEQEGYQGIDYTQREYNDTIDMLKSTYDTDHFKVIARKNALTKLVGNSERYKTCWSTPALWFYVSGNGDVYACGAHVGNPHFFLGNIENESIETIWKSDNRKKCLDHVQDELDLSTCRRTCRMDEVNNYLSKVIDTPPEHLNFI